MEPRPITTNMELVIPGRGSHQSSTSSSPSSSLENQHSDHISPLTAFATTTATTTKTTTTTHSQFPQPDPSQPLFAKPAPTDVICGRGKMTIAHPGNRRFRELVLEKKNEYKNAKRRDDKTRITFDLVQKLRSGPEGGRFVMFDSKSKMWYDVGDDYAREKVSHSLRSRPTEPRGGGKNPVANNCSSSSSPSSSSAPIGTSATASSTKPRPRRKLVRKPLYSPELEKMVHQLIEEQQALLKSMIKKETSSTSSTTAPTTNLHVPHSPDSSRTPPSTPTTSPSSCGPFVSLVAPTAAATSKIASTTSDSSTTKGSDLHGQDVHKE